MAEFDILSEPLETELGGIIIDNDLTEAELFKFFLNDDGLSSTVPKADLSFPVVFDSSDSFQTVPNSSPHGSDLESPYSPPSSPATFFSSPELSPFDSPLKSEEMNLSSSENNSFCAIQVKEEQEDEYVSFVPRENEPESKKRVPATSYSLTKEDLVKASSKTDSFSQQRRTLSPEEERQLKRQRRLIKNRESAQLSRQRKKIYIDELEKKVSKINAENEELNRKVTSLTAENQQLKDEVIYLHNIIKQSPGLSSVIAMRKSNVAPKGTSNPALTRPVKAAGMCLLVVLLSFGLFFNNELSKRYMETNLVSDGLSESVSSRKLLESPQIEPSLEAFEQVEVENRRFLPTREDVETIQPLPKKHEREIIVSRESGIKRKKMKIVSEEEDLDAIIQSPTSTVAPKSEASLVSANQNLDVHHHHHYHQNCPSASGDKRAGMVAVKKIAAEASTRRWGARSEIPDSSYIYCSEAHEVLTTTSSNSTPSSTPTVVALLVPSTALNGTLPQELHTREPALVEVSCQILEMRLYPIYLLAESTIN